MTARKLFVVVFWKKRNHSECHILTALPNEKTTR